MKVFASIALLASALAAVQGHTKMDFPRVRGDPENPNTSQPDGPCLMAPLNGGPSCPEKPFPCGYPADRQVTQEFAPGQVFNVKFRNQNNPPPSGDQGRHNGGLCEFALSYDQGSTWTKIATYHRTCPDMFYDWPVRIPSNAPAGNCVFLWSWINAVGNREIYQNCADIRITGSNGGTLAPDPITVANLPGQPTLTPEGDPANSGNAKGSGPEQADIDANTSGGDAPTAPGGGDNPPPANPPPANPPPANPPPANPPSGGDGDNPPPANPPPANPPPASPPSGGDGDNPPPANPPPANPPPANPPSGGNGGDGDNPPPANPPPVNPPSGGNGGDYGGDYGNGGKGKHGKGHHGGKGGHKGKRPGRGPGKKAGDGDASCDTDGQ